MHPKWGNERRKFSIKKSLKFTSTKKAVDEEALKTLPKRCPNTCRFDKKGDTNDGTALAFGQKRDMNTPHRRSHTHIRRTKVRQKSFFFSFRFSIAKRKIGILIYHNLYGRRRLEETKGTTKKSLRILVIKMLTMTIKYEVIFTTAKNKKGIAGGREIGTDGKTLHA